MKRNNKGQAELTIPLLIAVLFFVLLTANNDTNKEKFQHQLVEEGLAIYYIDKDFNKRFKLLTKKEICGSNVERPGIPK